MNVTGELWGEDCPSGDDCEKTYGTDSGGVIVRLDRSRVVNPTDVGLAVPDHEMLLFIPDQQWNGGRA